MSRLGIRHAAGLLALAATSFAASSCVENRSSLYMVGQFSYSSSTTVCSVDSASESFVLSPTWDLLFRSNYEARFIMENQLVQTVDAGNLRTEKNGVHIEWAEVELLDTEEGVLIPLSSVPVNAYIPPMEGNSPGRNVASFTLISFSQFAALGTIPASIIARVRFRARTLGGKEFVTDYFNYPITVCEGCLCLDPDDSTDTTACAPGQDNELTASRVCDL